MKLTQNQKNELLSKYIENEDKLFKSLSKISELKKRKALLLNQLKT